jgi:hypothetical protein
MQFDYPYSSGLSRTHFVVPKLFWRRAAAGGPRTLRVIFHSLVRAVVPNTLLSTKQFKFLKSTTILRSDFLQLSKISVSPGIALYSMNNNSKSRTLEIFMIYIL